MGTGPVSACDEGSDEEVVCRMVGEGKGEGEGEGEEKGRAVSALKGMSSAEEGFLTAYLILLILSLFLFNALV